MKVLRARMDVDVREWSQDNEMNPIACLLARFDDIGCAVTLNGNGNIVGLSYEGTYDALYRVLLDVAKYTSDDSRVECVTEGGSTRLFLFRGGRMMVVIKKPDWSNT